MTFEARNWQGQDDTIINDLRHSARSAVLALMLKHDDAFLADLAQTIKDYGEAKDDGPNYESAHEDEEDGVGL